MGRFFCHSMRHRVGPESFVASSMHLARTRESNLLKAYRESSEVTASLNLSRISYSTHFVQCLSLCALPATGTTSL